MPVSTDSSPIDTHVCQVSGHSSSPARTSAIGVAVTRPIGMIVAMKSMSGTPRPRAYFDAE